MLGGLLVIALLVFGPKRMQALGRSFGEAIREFRHGLGESDQE